MKPLIFNFCLVFFLAIVPFHLSWASEYYVSPDGNDDTGVGTLDNPWRTPQRAADEAGPGDTIMLRAGVYRPSAPALSMIDFPPGTATAANPILLKAFPGETVELNGMLDLSGAANWTFDEQRGAFFLDGLSPTINPDGKEEIAIVVQGNPPNDTALEPVGSLSALKNKQGATYWDAGKNRLYINPMGGGNPGDYPIQVSQILDQIILFQDQDQYIHIGDDDGTLKIAGSFYGIRATPHSGHHVITNVQFRHFREDAIKFNTIGNTGDIVENCDISSFGDYGIDSFGSNNQIFRGNRFTEVHPWKSGGAIKLLCGASDIVLEGNIARSLGGSNEGEAAFELREVNNIEVVNNVIADTAASAILVYSDPKRLTNCSAPNLSTQVRIINNTIYKTGAAAVWISDNSENVSFFNNSIYKLTRTGALSRALRVDQKGSVGFTSDYNNLFQRQRDGKAVRWFGRNYKLERYQSITGLDAGSLSVDPDYTNPEAGDFAPLINSAIIDAGWDQVAPATDIDGVSRPQSFAADMGAYEIEITEPVVMSPNDAGIVVETGQQLEIAWRPFSGSAVEIQLYEGSELSHQIVDNTPNTGVFDWTVPDDLAPGSDYSIKILSATDTSKFDFSDNAFTVSEPRPAVTYPSEPGITLERGQEVNITWTAYTDSEVKIILFRGSRKAEKIVDSTPNTGSFSWTIPSSLRPRDNYKIRVRSISVSSESDLSDNPFSIQ